MKAKPLKIGPFLLHPTQGLSLQGREIRVTPKSLAVLGVLADRPGQIVTKQELFESVWGGTVVTDASLTSCIRDLRQALGDDARNPRYIETVHRRGFRLLVTHTGVGDERAPSAPALPEPTWKTVSGEAPLNRLDALAGQARGGTTRVAILAGPLGAGKSSLAAHLFARLSSANGWLACRAGGAHPADTGRAYGPLLDLAQRLRAIRDRRVDSALRHHAATWIAALPPEGGDGESRELFYRTSGATAALRDAEMTKALGAVADIKPLALCIENLQWCDEQTLEWLAAFVDELGTFPVLLVLTVDPDAIEADGRHGELLAGLLAAGNVTRVDLESPGGDDSSGAIGNGAPLNASLQAALEAGSVVGPRFSAAEVAAAVDWSDEEATARLEQIVERSTRLFPAGTEHWPDGTSSAAFAFANRDDRAALLRALSPPDHARMLGRIARRLEAGWAEHPACIAPRLADLYERADKFDQAVDALLAAGNAARQRGSHAVAFRNFTRAGVLLESLPPTPSRDLLVAEVDTSLGRELVYIQGLDSAAANERFRRAAERRLVLPETAERCQIVWRCWVYYLNRGRLGKALELANELLELASRIDDPTLILQGYHALWSTDLTLGDFESVRSHTGLGMGVCGSGTNGSLPMTMGCTLHDSHLTDHHAAVCAGSFSAFADAVRGRKDTAVRSLDAAVAHARDIGHPFTLALTLVFSAAVMAAAGDAGLTRSRAVEARAVAQRHGFPVPEAWACVYEGWSTVVLGDGPAGLALMDAGLAASASMGLTLFRPFQLSLAASAKAASGQFDAAAKCLDEAFSVAARTGDRLALAELHRLRGELAYTRNFDPDDLVQADTDLKSAVRIATAQGAELWAKRATDGLTRLRGTGIAEQPPASRQIH